MLIPTAVFVAGVLLLSGEMYAGISVIRGNSLAVDDAPKSVLDATAALCSVSQVIVYSYSCSRSHLLTGLR